MEQPGAQRSAQANTLMMTVRWSSPALCCCSHANMRDPSGRLHCAAAFRPDFPSASGLLALRWAEDVGFGAEGRTEVSGVNLWPKPRAIPNNRLETRRAELSVQRNEREAADHPLQHHGEWRPAPTSDYPLEPERAPRVQLPNPEYSLAFSFHTQPRKKKKRKESKRGRQHTARVMYSLLK